jgi:hypothetical protein
MGVCCCGGHLLDGASVMGHCGLSFCSCSCFFSLFSFSFLLFSDRKWRMVFYWDPYLFVLVSYLDKLLGSYIIAISPNYM